MFKLIMMNRSSKWDFSFCILLLSGMRDQLCDDSSHVQRLLAGFFILYCFFLVTGLNRTQSEKNHWPDLFRSRSTGHEVFLHRELLSMCLKIRLEILVREYSKELFCFKFFRVLP